MGEVYRGRDTRLERTVAIKVLPAHLAANAEYRQRLEREARAIASLNHPHICQLHDIGSQDGIDFLVMEYLEGETLASRLGGGALAVEEVLRYGIQVADALDKAHGKGITHRDLKPGNVMLTKGGAKLLDFGLARMGVAGRGMADSAAPTVAAELTQMGTLLGTMQYMAPEQLQGKDADARSDIFALGVVLYEMASGRKAYPASDPATLIAAIMSSTPPPITTAPGKAPPALERAVRRCLVRDPDARWQSARDLMLELKAIAEGDVATAAAPLAAPQAAARRAWLPWVLWAGTALVCVVFAVLYYRRPAEEQRALRFFIYPEEKTPLGDTLAVSPDGKLLAFTAVSDGRVRIWVRPLDSLSARPLAGTENALFPFWSPDSRFLGFFADGKLKKVDVNGGAPQTLCDAANGTGGAWNRDGVILFAPGRGDALHRAPAAGGPSTPVTVFEQSRRENSHRWPHFLPDGRRFLYLVRSAQLEHHGLCAGDLNSKTQKRILNTLNRVAYAPPSGGGLGHLLFIREASLTAQPFDPEKLELRGEPFPVAEKVMRGGLFGGATFSVSANGLLAYRSGEGGGGQLAWFDRQGKRLETIGQQAYAYVGFALAPDGKRVVVARGDAGNLDLWLVDLARGNLPSRFTFDPATDWFPVWSPDGSRIAFATVREQAHAQAVYVKPSSGVGKEDLLHKGGSSIYPTDWSRDGRFLAYVETAGKTRQDVWVVPLAGDRKPIPFLQTEFSERSARFSPDAKWIAYVSDESSRTEVYVQAFQPGSGVVGKWQISSVGGSEPVWRRDGQELFYMAPDGSIMSVEIKAGAGFQAGVPRPLFQARPPDQGAGVQRFDVTADGRRFLVLTYAEEAAASPITVVTNWMRR